jgi:hypothetical protein
MSPSARFTTSAVMAWLHVVTMVTPLVAQTRDYSWIAFRDSRLGFSFDYPSALFVAEAGDPTDALKDLTSKRSGQVFRSRDGKAYLQAAAFENTQRVGPAAYKALVAGSTYRDTRITYDRVGDTYFVLSGIRGTDEYYERVTFSCGGRLINVWTMTYPIASRGLYDRIVEEIARTFRPAEGPQSCG